MGTNDILRDALYAAGDASDRLVPGSGRHYRAFADEHYSQPGYRPVDCPNCGRRRVQSDGVCEKCLWDSDSSNYASITRPDEYDTQGYIYHRPDENLILEARPSEYCDVDGMLLDENGDCPRCQASAAAEQRDDDAEDMAYED